MCRHITMLPRFSLGINDTKKSNRFSVMEYKDNVAWFHGIHGLWMIHPQTNSPPDDSLPLCEKLIPYDDSSPRMINP